MSFFSEVFDAFRGRWSGPGPPRRRTPRATPQRRRRRRRPRVVRPRRPRRPRRLRARRSSPARRSDGRFSTDFDGISSNFNDSQGLFESFLEFSSRLFGVFNAFSAMSEALELQDEDAEAVETQREEPLAPTGDYRLAISVLGAAGLKAEADPFCAPWLSS